jgi:nucleoside-diphosphate-sugar epimerase
MLCRPLDEACRQMKASSCDAGVEQMRILVTGAAGRLGSAVCFTLTARGHDVLGTDRKATRRGHARFELADLIDEEQVRPLLRGLDAVVHLGNHPRLDPSLSDARLLAENVAMNEHVFQAAVAHGVPRIVFSSSIQVMLPMPNGAPPGRPYPLPYLPLDGAAPRNPGSNAYAESKASAERQLEAIAAENSWAHCAALRFPMIPDGFWLRRFAKGNRVARSDLNFGEALSFLLLEEAAEATAAVVEGTPSGYRQYFPAQALELRNLSLSSIIESEYSHVPLAGPLAMISSLVNVEDLTRAVGWKAKRSLAVTLQ